MGAAGVSKAVAGRQLRALGESRWDEGEQVRWSGSSPPDLYLPFKAAMVVVGVPLATMMEDRDV